MMIIIDDTDDIDAKTAIHVAIFALRHALPEK